MPEKYSYNEVKKIFENKGYSLLEKEYFNNRTRMKVEKDGYLGYITLDSFNSGKSFSICSKSNPYSIQNIQHYLSINNTGARILTDEYKSNSSKLKLQCECGNVFYRNWSDLCATTYAKCKECTIKERVSKRKANNQDIIKEFNQQGYQILSMDYKNIDSRILCKDSKGYIGYFSLHGLRMGHQLNPFNQPVLSKNYQIHNLNTYLLNNQRQLRVIDIVGKTNKFTSDVLKCVCPMCGKEFEMPKATFFFGKDCCFECVNIYSKYSVLVENWLKDNDLRYVREKKFIGCTDKTFLPFDFYVEQYNICIEVDGEGHYYPVQFNGMKKEKALQQFQITQRHDKIKDEFCKNQKIKLLRISYKEIKTNEYKNKLANIFKGGNL